MVTYKLVLIALKNLRRTTLAFVGGVSRVCKPFFFYVSDCLGIDDRPLINVLSRGEIGLEGGAWRLVFSAFTFRFSNVRHTQSAGIFLLWVCRQLNMAYCRTQQSFLKLDGVLQPRMKFWIFRLKIFDSQAIDAVWGTRLAGQWTIYAFITMRSWRPTSRLLDFVTKIIVDLAYMKFGFRRVQNLMARRNLCIYWFGFFWWCRQLNHPLQNSLLEAGVLHCDPTKRHHWLFL